MKKTQARESNFQGIEIIHARHIGGYKEEYIR